MTPTLRDFIDRLEAHNVKPAYEFVPSKWIGSSLCSPCLIIPAAHQAVRVLTVYDDIDEVTVEIGRLHHAHFSAYNYDSDTIEKRLQAATNDAARFVADIFADRVFFSIDYADERCIGSSHGYVDSDGQASGRVRMPDAPLFSEETTRSELYVWSSPISTK